MRQGRVRIISALLASMLLWATPLQEAGAKPQECPALGQVLEFGRWTAIRGPIYTPRPTPLDPNPKSRPSIGMYAVDPLSPTTLYVTHPRNPFSGDPTVVFRSIDGGCTFEEVFRADLNITSLVVPEWDPSRVFVLATDSFNILHLFRGDDFGTKWSELDLGPAGEYPTRVAYLKVGPRSTGVLYLTVEEPSPVFSYSSLWAYSLYASLDSGNSWERRYSSASFGAADPDRPCSWQRLAVDPLERDDVWIAGQDCDAVARAQYSNGVPGARWVGDELWHSNDGGRTWKPIDTGAAGRIHFLDVYHRVGGSPQISIATSIISSGAQDRMILLSVDEGTSWSPIPIVMEDKVSSSGLPTVRGRGPLDFAVVQINIGGSLAEWYAELYKFHQQSGRFVPLGVPKSLWPNNGYDLFSPTADAKGNLYVVGGGRSLVGDYLLRYSSGRSS